MSCIAIAIEIIAIVIGASITAIIIIATIFTIIIFTHRNQSMRTY